MRGAKRRGKEEAPQKETFSSRLRRLPAFGRQLGVAWARSRRSGEQFLCPARRPVRGSSASGKAGRMAMVTGRPKDPQSRVLPFLADLLLVAQLQCHSARDRRLPVRSLDWCRRP